MITYTPPLTDPDTLAPALLYNLTIVPISPVSKVPVTFTLDFSKPMSPTVSPTVTFGISPTMDTHVVAGSWVSSTQWVGTYDVTYYTGDGVQRVRVAGAVGADDGIEIPQDTSFTFEIATIRAASINAEPGYSYVALSWPPSDIETLAGYNVYRATQSGGPYTRTNTTILTTASCTDTSVTNGTAYYYVVKILTTDLRELDYGSEAAATPNDFTAPTTPVVVDDGTCTPYDDHLHAIWSASDPDSGITEYQYSIGTWAGGADVIGWQSVDTSTEITHTGLSLIKGVTYYFNSGAWHLLSPPHYSYLISLSSLHISRAVATGRPDSSSIRYPHLTPGRIVAPGPVGPGGVCTVQLEAALLQVGADVGQARIAQKQDLYYN